MLGRLGIDLATLRDLTWDAFVEFPEELLRVAELHDGGVVLMVDGTPIHQRAIGRLFYALETWVRSPIGFGECMAEGYARIDDRNGYKPRVATSAPASPRCGSSTPTPTPYGSRPPAAPRRSPDRERSPAPSSPASS